jgi:hypothetical protein
MVTLDASVRPGLDRVPRGPPAAETRRVLTQVWKRRITSLNRITSLVAVSLWPRVPDYRARLGARSIRHLVPVGRDSGETSLSVDDGLGRPTCRHLPHESMGGSVGLQLTHRCVDSVWINQSGEIDVDKRFLVEDVHCKPDHLHRLINLHDLAYLSRQRSTRDKRFIAFVVRHPHRAPVCRHTCPGDKPSVPATK